MEEIRKELKGVETEPYLGYKKMLEGITEYITEIIKGKEEKEEERKEKNEEQEKQEIQEEKAIKEREEKEEERKEIKKDESKIRKKNEWV
jgi:hypothetical protein